MNQYIFIFGITCCLTFISGEKNISYSEARCFKFTWLGSGDTENPLLVDCACPKSGKTPCTAPCVITDNSKPPDTNWMINNLTSITCSLASGTCIKYSYIYDNTVLNTTYFCGKMTEDQTNPITNGCYTHTVNGYTIEACACKSLTGQLPCNSSPPTCLTLSAFIFLIMILPISQILWKLS